MGVRQLCLRRIGVRGQKSLKTAAVYSRHFVVSRINAAAAVVAVVFTLDHIVTTQTTMGWTESLQYRLEQYAGQREICPVSVNLPSACKTFVFQALFNDIIIDHR